MKRALAVVLVCATAACASLSSAPGESRADARFRAIYEAEWEWRQASEPEEDSDTPEEEKSPRTWGKVDPATQAERLAYMKDVLTKLDAIDPKSLSADAQVNLAVYRNQIEARIARIEFRAYERPLNADTTFWTSVAGSLHEIVGKSIRARGCRRQLRRTILHRPYARLAFASTVDRWTETEEIPRRVVVVAGHFHPHTVHGPFAAGRAVMDRHDVPVIGNAKLHATAEFFRCGDIPLCRYAMRDHA